MGLLSGVTDTDSRVIVLALARMVGAAGNSFLIVVLPLYIASDLVDIDSLLGTSVGVGAASVTLTEPLLIGLVLSLFGFLNSLSQPLTGRLSDRTGRRRVYILAGLAPPDLPRVLAVEIHPIKLDGRTGPVLDRLADLGYEIDARLTHDGHPLDEAAFAALLEGETPSVADPDHQTFPPVVVAIRDGSD